MNKIEANILLDNAFIKLNLMKNYYDNRQKLRELDSVEKGNQELIADSLSAIEEGKLTVMEVTCIYDDTLSLWEELAPVMARESREV